MSDSKNLLDRLNSTPVTKKDIVQVNEQAELLHQRGKPAASVGFATIARLYNGDFEKSAAVYFRIQALACLLVKEGLPGWTLPATEDAVFSAAAAEPLTEIDGDIAFDPESFSDKILELAEPQGTG